MSHIKTFTFFVEPSRYTLELIEQVHEPSGIEYTFLQESALIAKDEKAKNIEALRTTPWPKRISKILDILDSFDLIIFNGYNFAEFWLLFIANALKEEKRFIAIESDTQAKEDTGIKGWLKRQILGRLFKRPYVLGFAGGSHTHKDLFRKYDMAEERIFLMPMMVNNEKFSTDGQKRPETPFTFLYVGRVIPHKNVKMAIESFIAAFGESDSALFRIVGEGSSLQELKREYESRRNIRFEGAKHADELIDAYHTSHALVLPSLYEPWGLVVNEALSAGLPVLASKRVGAIYDLVEQKETGFTFDPENVTDLAEKMKRVAEDPALYKRFSENAVSLMQNVWNYDLYEREFKRALDFVAKKIGAGR